MWFKITLTIKFQTIITDGNTTMSLMENIKDLNANCIIMRKTAYCFSIHFIRHREMQNGKFMKKYLARFASFLKDTRLSKSFQRNILIRIDGVLLYSTKTGLKLLQTPHISLAEFSEVDDCNELQSSLLN